MNADTQKYHIVVHKIDKIKLWKLTVDEAETVLMSHPEYILPPNSKKIHLLQNHKSWGYQDAELLLKFVLLILRREIVHRTWGIP